MCKMKVLKMGNVFSMRNPKSKMHGFKKNNPTNTILTYFYLKGVVYTRGKDVKTKKRKHI